MSTGREWGYVIGAAVGYFTGGASYIALGATAGGIIGGLIDGPQKVEGPRLDDLKVQYSSYGAGVPILNGTMRISPNVIWSTNKIEIGSTSTQGKGGGVENTTYRYFVHMRLLLCETPRDGSTVNIVQIFQDGKLIYDAHSDVPVESALASDDNPYSFYTLYQGHADQLPDAVEQLNNGTDPVPAYRGVVSISMKAIGCPGGRIPQFSFVLSNNATVGPVSLPWSQAPALAPSATNVWGVVRENEAYHYDVTGADSSGTFAVTSYYVGGGDAREVSKFAWPFIHTGYSPIPLSGDGPMGALRLRLTGGYGEPAVIELLNFTYGNLVEITTWTPGSQDNMILSTQDVSASYNEELARFAVRGGGTGLNLNDNRIALFSKGTSLQFGDVIAGEVGAIFMTALKLYAVTFDDGKLKLCVLNVDTAEVESYIDGPSVSDPFMMDTGLYLKGDAAFVYVRDDGGGGGDDYLAVKFDLIGETGEVISHQVYPQAGSLASPPRTIYATDNYMLLGPTGSSGSFDHVYSMVRFRALTTGNLAVRDVIAEQCERAQEVRYDISDLPADDYMQGIVFANPASARANIAPLLTAYGYFAVEEDGFSRFKRYEDIVENGVVTYDELGAVEEAGDPIDPFPLSRKLEKDLPRSMSVNYIEPTFDYQVATETEVRLITEATEDQSVQIPAAIGSDQAKKTAQVLMYAGWRSQNMRSTKLSRKFAYISPGDGLEIEYPPGNNALWRVLSMNDNGLTIEVDLEPADAELYQQPAVGATGYVGQEVSPLTPQTQLVFGDWPIFRDEDNNAGIYIPMVAMGSGWNGAELLIGDDAFNVEPYGSVTVPSVVGQARSVLGAPFLPGVVDHKNALTINLPASATLSSITHDVLLTGNLNVAVVGNDGRWEVIKFQTATSLGDGNWRLTNLLRGLRGTEWATSTHTGTDRFVLVNKAGMLRPNLDAGSIGQLKVYKPVSKGRDPDKAPSYTYRNTAEGLVPFSPTNLDRDGSAGGDIELSWSRRTRLSENWLNDIVPIGEAYEAYDVEIWSSGFTAVLRTIRTTTPSATYTLAMQLEDGYTSGPVNVTVYQISDVVGRGNGLQVSI